MGTSSRLRRNPMPTWIEDLAVLLIRIAVRVFQPLD